MPPGKPSNVHVSPNRLEGSLEDVALERLVDSCRRHMVTGVIRILTEDSEGMLELRGGVVDDASYGELSGDAALRRLFGLNAGLYELAQTLPTFDGELGDGAQCWGDLADVPLAQVMRHCEDHALSCTVVVVSEFDRGEIVYDTGDITAVALNGVVDDDAIVTITHWTAGKFRMTAPPLELDIEGWPVVSGQPTAPFQVEHLAARPRTRVARGTPSPLRRPTLPGMPVPDPSLARGKGRVPPSRRTLDRTIVGADIEPAVTLPPPADIVVDDEPPDVLIDDREWKVRPDQRAPSVIEIEADLPPDDDNYYTDPDMDLSWQPTRVRPPTETELVAASPPPPRAPTVIPRAAPPRNVTLERPVVEVPPRRAAAISRADTETDFDSDVISDMVNRAFDDLNAETQPEHAPVPDAPTADFISAPAPSDLGSATAHAFAASEYDDVDPSPSASFELAAPPRPMRMAATDTEWGNDHGTAARTFATLALLALAVFGAFYFLTNF